MLVWIARSLLLSVLIGAAAHCAETALRGRLTATRWIWAAALVLTVLLPIATTLPGDAWPSALRAPAFLAALRKPDADISYLLQQRANDAPATSVALPVIDQKQGSTRPALIGLWAAASLFFLLRYLHGWRRLSRVRRTWREGELLGGSVLISGGLGPAVVGFIRAHVVVPEWVLSAPVERQRMIVDHEREHVRARDHVALAVAPLLVLVFPWNVIVWWQLRRFRLAVECDCDARVLRAGARRSAYGRMLLDIATTRPELTAMLAGLIEPRSLLQRRIEAMKAGQVRQHLLRVVMLQSAAAGALVTAVLLTLPPSTPVQAQTPARVQQQAPRAGELLYVVDGKVLGTRASLDAASAGVHVGRIQVLSPAAAQARYGAQAVNGAVLITTQRPAAAPARPRQDQRQDNVRVETPTLPVLPRVVLRDTTVPLVVREIDQQDSVRVRIRTADGTRVINADGVVIVDGQVQEKIRDAAAVQLYGTRQNATQEKQVLMPLVIIDGVFYYSGTTDLINRLDPGTIDHIEVLKGPAALTAYGERARDGVILITTKKK
jgi:TonB-dependent SusC/RagA subfamily outer membrane receptor